ncbi:MAG: HAD family hydrolase [Candidatus Lokiarchaeota archaeon]|nr:HAD family hydrolase [Candidatus Lokiarchaeota archaeon]
MLLKGVFFDLYGTLLIPKNSKKAWKNWFITFYRLMRWYGLKISKKDFANACNGFFTRVELLENDEDLTIYENKIRKFAINLNIKLEKLEIKKIANECVNAWHKYIKIDPETLPLLEALKNKKSIALITNFDHPPYIYSVLSKYHLTKYFEFIAISGEIHIRKPDPEIFNISLKKIGLIADEVVFIGDSKEDIEGATNAGIKPILIQHQSSKRMLTGNDYFSKKIAKKLNLQNSRIKPWRTISNLRDLYKLLYL